MIVWIDLETSGLEPVGGCIIEVAVVITDDELDEIARYESLVAPIVSPSKWEPFARAMHEKSGLLALLEEGTYHQPHVIAQTIQGLIKLNGAEGAPLGGSSVHFDRAWLKEHMPEAEATLGYRNIDISTLKELVNRWKPYLAESRDKRLAVDEKPHRAMADIQATLTEARFYRDYLFNSKISGGVS